MTINRKPTGRAVSLPGGLALGLTASVGMTLLGALLAAKLIDAQLLEWKHTGYAVLLILLLSSWTGASLAGRKTKRRRLLVCGASAAVYFGVLLIVTALFFGGQYSGVGETALLVFCGAGLAALPGRGQRKSGRYNR